MFNKICICTVTIFICFFNIESSNGQKGAERFENSLQEERLKKLIDSRNHSGRPVINKLKRNSSQLFGYELKIDLSTVPDGNLAEDYEHWRASGNFYREYPFYLTGFDYKNRPVWIAEMGKFNMVPIAHGSKAKKDEFEKFIRQSCYVGIKSHKMIDPNNKQHVLLIDFEGLRLEQVSDPLIISYTFNYGRRFRRFFEKNVGKIYAININPVTEIVINLARPLFSRMLGRVESYGTNRDQWIPQLHKSIPQNQLPEWYGGPVGHKPLHIFG